MNPDRKAARERCMNIKTRRDLEDYIESLNLPDDEKRIAYMMFGDCWTRTKIAIETGYSKRQLARKIAHIYDRMV